MSNNQSNKRKPPPGSIYHIFSSYKASSSPPRQNKNKKSKSSNDNNNSSSSSWNCPACTYLNDLNDQVCEGCSTHHPTSWACQRCTTVNASHLEKCGACLLNKPTSAPTTNATGSALNVDNQQAAAAAAPTSQSGMDLDDNNEESKVAAQHTPKDTHKTPTSVASSSVLPIGAGTKSSARSTTVGGTNRGNNNRTTAPTQRRMMMELDEAGTGADSVANPRGRPSVELGAKENYVRQQEKAWWNNSIQKAMGMCQLKSTEEGDDDEDDIDAADFVKALKSEAERKVEDSSVESAAAGMDFESAISSGQAMSFKIPAKSCKDGCGKKDCSAGEKASSHQNNIDKATKVYYLSPDQLCCIDCEKEGMNTPAVTLPALAPGTESSPGEYRPTHCWGCANKQTKKHGTVFNPDPPICGCNTTRYEGYVDCANCVSTRECANYEECNNERGKKNMYSPYCEICRMNNVWGRDKVCTECGKLGIEIYGTKVCNQCTRINRAKRENGGEVPSCERCELPLYDDGESYAALGQKRKLCNRDDCFRLCEERDGDGKLVCHEEVLVNSAIFYSVNKYCEEHHKGFVCHKCNAVLGNSKTLSTHLRDGTLTCKADARPKPEQKEFVCKKGCGRSYPKKGSLAAHNLKGAGAEPGKGYEKCEGKFGTFGAPQYKKYLEEKKKKENSKS